MPLQASGQRLTAALPQALNVLPHSRKRTPRRYFKMAFYEDWYARFARLDQIDAELNDDPYRETPNRPMPWFRCATGIIVASLIGRPDYDALASAYTGILRDFSNGFYLPRFEALLRERAAARGGTG